MSEQQLELPVPKKKKNTMQILVELEEKRNQTESIASQIENLKKQLKIITNDYHRRAYIILKKIIQLKNIQRTQQGKKLRAGRGKLYGVTNLLREEGIHMTKQKETKLVKRIACSKCIKAYHLEKEMLGQLGDTCFWCCANLIRGEEQK